MNKLKLDLVGNRHRAFKDAFVAFNISKFEKDKDFWAALTTCRKEGYVPLSLEDIMQERLWVAQPGRQASKSAIENWCDNSIVSTTGVLYFGQEVSFLAPRAKQFLNLPRTTQINDLRLTLTAKEYVKIKVPPWKRFQRRALIDSQNHIPLDAQAAASHYAWRHSAGMGITATYARWQEKREKGMTVDLSGLGQLHKLPTLYPLILASVRAGSTLYNTRFSPSTHVLIGRKSGVEGPDIREQVTLYLVKERYLSPFALKYLQQHGTLLTHGSRRARIDGLLSSIFGTEGVSERLDSTVQDLLRCSLVAEQEEENTVRFVLTPAGQQVYGNRCGAKLLQKYMR